MTTLDKVKPKIKQSGFTIIELLVVIAIIAILAAITTIAYTGIRQRAIISSLQSDLSNDSTQLKLYQITNDSYPTSNDCSTGPNPAPPKICLKTSPGNTYVNYVIDNGDPQTFCITEENSGINYRVTNNTGPVAGICNTVTTSPSSLVATGGIGQIVLNWTAPSDNGGSTITGYKVYQGTSTGNETLLTTIGNVLTYTSTGLSTGTTYYYKVIAINVIGESGYSNEASDTTIIATPAAPAIAVTLNGSNILATISPVTCTAGTIQYGIRSRTNDGTWGSYSAWSSTTTATQAASEGTKYGYQAQARCYSVATTSATSTGTEATYIKPITTIPTVPAVTANTVTTTTTWSWPASTGCPAGTSVSYRYDYTITPSGYDSGWTAITASPISFTTATGGQTYTVNVQAKCYNAYVSGGWSGSGSASYYRPVVPVPDQIYTTPGTYIFTVPAGINQITALIASGGGGGGGGGYNGGFALTSGGGGGGGSGSTITPITVTPGQQLTVVVGSGGAGGQGSNSNIGQTAGTAGTSSSVGTVSVSGGGGGSYGSGTSVGSGGVGGSVTNGSYNLSSPGYYGGWTEGYAGVGASSIFGQGGGYSTSAGAGAGGHGGQNNSGGAAGGNGRVVIMSSINQSHNYQIYTTPGTYIFTVPVGVNQIATSVASGGGGGGGGGYNGGYALTSGGGGGGGAGSTITPITVTPGQQLTVVVGSGGAGGQGSNNNSGQTAGIAGTSSSVGTVSVSGGGGGSYGSGTSVGSGGSGGSVVNGSYNLSSPGYYGGWTEGYAGVGASSIFGQGGGYSTSAGAGAGGHGGQNNSGGAAGGNGKVLILW